MPKVLRILNRFNLGGPTYNAAYLSKYLPADYETLLIGGAKDDSEASSIHITDELGIDPVIIPEMKRSLNPINDYKSYKTIRNIIADYKPDIVHTHASKAGFIGRMAALHENVPVIVHTFHGHVFHGYFNPLKTFIFKRIERFLAKKSNRIIAISEIQKNELSSEHNICSKSKIEVIPLGFDLERFQNGIDRKRDEFRVAYLLEKDTVAIGIIGRLVPIKNHQLFLKGIKYLKKNTKVNFQAFIIGDGESRAEIEKLARQMGLSIDNMPNTKVDIIFTSWIKNIDLALAGLDLVTLTSLNEGTPVSLIEAQAAEKAIVSTNVGGIENVVIPNKSALLSELDDEEKYCANLLSITTNQDLREKMSRAGKDFVFTNFHYNRLIKDTSRLYQELLVK